MLPIHKSAADLVAGVYACAREENGENIVRAFSSLWIEECAWAKTPFRGRRSLFSLFEGIWSYQFTCAVHCATRFEVRKINISAAARCEMAASGYVKRRICIAENE